MDTSNTAITKDLSWIGSHLVLLLVVALLVFGGVYGVESLLNRRAAENDAKWQAILKQQAAQTQSLQQQISQDEKQWAQTFAKLTAQNAQLATTVAQRNQELQQQEKQNATLTASQAAVRLAAQTQAGTGEISVAGDSVTIDLPITRRIVDSLDSLTAAQADLVDTKKQLENETVIATNAQSDAAQQKKLVAGTQQLVTDAQDACEAQVAALKAAHRKSILKVIFVSLGIGVGIGAHYF